ARLLLHLHPDAHTMIAALLQYAEGKEQMLSIERRFGKRTVRTITTLAMLERNWGKTPTYSTAYLRKMTEALSEDIRVLLVALHNRLHALEQPQSFDEKTRRTLAREVLDVFAPLSARLGVYSLKYALETLAFGILYPEEAQTIEQTLKNLRRQQGPFTSESARALKRTLLKEGRRAEIIGREKHPYSIFRKMQQKGTSKITDLHDLFGLRILVDSVEDCYQVLGFIHRIYRPILHHMKDYIAFPKPNGYRSLHTTILGLNARDASLPVEIQIRTHAMDEEAEYGIAAHWNYKEGGREEPQRQKVWRERLRALQQLSKKSGSKENPSDVLNEMLTDHIYVLTPQGDPIELPKGATPLDFAFRVHTDIGLCFKSAKVNGAIASLNRVLENGDMVEILKGAIPRPSQQWMQIVRTSDARAKLRTYFRLEQERITPTLKQTLAGLSRATEQREWRTTKKKGKSIPARTLIALDAETPLPHRFAKCCHPEAPDAKHPPILGFITRGGIVTVHRKNCRMLRDANASRCITAAWRENVSH
ncbi:MAG: TGS domain-containing protein, partial [Patescibacteria group bacterium]